MPEYFCDICGQEMPDTDWGSEIICDNCKQMSSIELGSYFDQKNRESMSSDGILLGVNGIGIFFTP